MLTERFASVLPAWLQSKDSYHPFPTVEERTPWETLPGDVRQAHIALGDEARSLAWPQLPAILYLQFPRAGNRLQYEVPYFRRRAMVGALVLAECVEAQGRFLDDIVDGLWLICEESTWCLPAHIRHQQAGVTLPDTTEPIVDLFAAETGAMLAWTLYLLGPRLDTVSPVVRPRLEREITARILTPCLERDDFGWMGFAHTGRRVNNWNPWIVSNWLASILLVEEDDDLRVQGVTKAVRALDNFVDPYPRDGGCDEGPNYWGRAGASLFDCLELLLGATGGRLDVYDDPLVREIGRFVYRAHIDGDFYLNFADASAVVEPEAMLVFRYGQRIEDEQMVRYGAWLARRQNVLDNGIVVGTGRVPPSLGRALPELFALDALQGVTPEPPLLRDVWLPEIEVMVARDADGTAEGFYVAAKGGNNDESHNHNDIGNFVVYRDGKPVLVDAGVETYTAKTFSADRYEIWTMQSAYHTLLPTIDGVQQAPGPAYAARAVSYSADDAQASFSLEIAGAYPAEAKLPSWQRSITLERGHAVEIVDQYRLTAEVQQLEMTLLTPCAVDYAGDGVIRLAPATFAGGREAGSAVIHIDSALSVRTEAVPITDERMGPVWGESLTRVILAATNPSVEGTFRYRIT